MIFYPSDFLRNYYANCAFNRAQARREREQQRRADVDRESVRNGEQAVAEAVADAEGQGQL